MKCVFRVHPVLNAPESQGTAIKLGGVNQMAMEYEAQRTEADNDSESEEMEKDEDNI